jgi:hypothetical protein
VDKLLSVDAGKPEIAKVDSPQAEPECAIAIYYGVLFRDRNGSPQLATDNFYDERKRAEKFIELHKACKAEDTKTDCFIGTLSVPVSAEEAAKCASL